MIKICMISGSYPPIKCGVGDYTYILSNELENIANIKVNVITNTKNNNDELISYNIDKWTFKNIFKILKYVKKINPDLAHIQYPTSEYGKSLMINCLPLLLRLNKIKVVLTVHEYSDSSLLGKIRTLIGTCFANSIIVVDKRYKEDIEKVLKFKQKDINYINIASNIPKSNITLKEKEILRSKILEGSNYNKIISYFGFIHDKKGIESLLLAIRNLKHNNKLFSKLLIIAELNKSNQYHKSILSMIDSYNLSNDVFVTGYLSDKDVAKYLNISDFSVLPFVDGVSYKNGSMLACLQEGNLVITTESKRKDFEIEGVITIGKFDDVLSLENKIYEVQMMNKYNIEFEAFIWENIAEKHCKLYLEVKND